MYWYTILLWLSLVDQSEPVTEPYLPDLQPPEEHELRHFLPGRRDWRIIIKKKEFTTSPLEPSLLELRLSTRRLKKKEIIRQFLPGRQRRLWRGLLQSLLESHQKPVVVVVVIVDDVVTVAAAVAAGSYFEQGRADYAPPLSYSHMTFNTLVCS